MKTSKIQYPSSREGPMKRSKIQDPRSRKDPRSKIQIEIDRRCRDLGSWNLLLPWILDLGSWIFFRRALSPRVTVRSVRGERGSVLIIVLWIAFGLVSLALYFAGSMS